MTRSEFLRNGTNFSLDDYVADRAPLYYRPLDKVLDDFKDGFFLSAIKDTLSKLPTAKNFKESHFGEIVSAIFAEEVLGLGLLYSKLSVLSAENANAYKMDLMLYDLSTSPPTFVFGEVKSSPKISQAGSPAGHDKSCYADIFQSLKKYEDSDLKFDLTAARDNIDKAPEADRATLRNALKPYAPMQHKYLGFALIDTSTYDDDEAQILRTRNSAKQLDIDLVCIESFPEVAANTYSILERYK